MSRPHNAADLRDLLLDALYELPETDDGYKVLERYVDVNIAADVAATKIQINGRVFTIMVREDGDGE